MYGSWSCPKLLDEIKKGDIKMIFLCKAAKTPVWPLLPTAIVAQAVQNQCYVRSLYI